MCTHRRYITNPYARNKRVLVDCGHCPSCLQKKADAKAKLISYVNSDGVIFRKVIREIHDYKELT